MKHDMQLPVSDRPKLAPSISTILYGLNDAGFSPSIFLPDQTPTPTRFLRNCEEIGLFQDLNKNPFDEDFRRAAENLSKGGSKLSSPLEEDVALVAPDSADILVDSSNHASIQESAVDDETQQASLGDNIGLVSDYNEELPSAVTDDNEGGGEDEGETQMAEAGLQTNGNRVVRLPNGEFIMLMSDDSQETSDGLLQQQPVALGYDVTVATGGADQSDSADEVIDPLANQLLAMSQGQFMTQFMVRMPSGALMPVNLPLSAPTASVVLQQPPTQLPRDSNSKNTSPSASFLTKQRLKAVLQQNMVHSGNTPSAADAMSDAVTVLRQDADTSSSLGKRSHKMEELIEDEKRQKFLERNRAAAARCRLKKKLKQHCIESKAEELTARLKKVENENASLRDEVAQLRRLLLAHRECPVTQQQQLTGQLLINGDQVSVMRAAAAPKARVQVTGNQGNAANKPIVVKAMPVIMSKSSTSTSLPTVIMVTNGNRMVS